MPDLVPVSTDELARLIEHSGGDRMLSMPWGRGAIYAADENAWALALLREWRGDYSVPAPWEDIDRGI